MTSITITISLAAIENETVGDALRRCGFPDFFHGVGDETYCGDAKAAPPPAPEPKQLTEPTNGPAQDFKGLDGGPLPSETEQPSDADLLDLVKRVIDAKGLPHVQKLLKSLGAERISELDPVKKSEFAAALRTAASEGLG